MMKFTTIADAKRQTGLSYLGSVNASAKLLKNGKVSQQHTYGLYLAPANVSGYNVCSHSTPECRMGCLNTSGRSGIEEFSGKTIIHDARVKKTRLFFEETAFFMAWMIAEIRTAQKKAITDGYGFSARLNCTSDINWQNVYIDGKNIFQIFPEVAFYDYTKNPDKFIEKPLNYHLTLSYTGKNWRSCEAILSKGFNVAMVFNVKHESQLPEIFNGYKVVNGDLTDYRINDAKGIIIGLKWKRISNRANEKKVLNSCFVIQPAEILAMSNVLELVA
jgi:hypothetical protein